MEGTYFFHLIFMRASIVQDGTIWDGDRTIAVYTSFFFNAYIERLLLFTSSSSRIQNSHIIIINTYTRIACRYILFIYLLILQLHSQTNKQQKGTRIVNAALLLVARAEFQSDLNWI